jgi:hypothetical protein
MDKCEKIVAVLYGDRGYWTLRPSIFYKLWGYIEKYLPKDKNLIGRIHCDTKYGDLLVWEQVNYLEEDLEMVVKIRSIVRNTFSKYVGEYVLKDEIDPKTYPCNLVYYGWRFWFPNHNFLQKIANRARPEILKQLRELEELK